MRQRQYVERQTATPQPKSTPKVAPAQVQAQSELPVPDHEPPDSQLGTNLLEQTATSFGSSAAGAVNPPRSFQPSPLAQIVQPKLTIGEPNDTGYAQASQRYEQEADRVAAAVVQRMHAATGSARGNDPSASNRDSNRAAAAQGGRLIARKPLKHGVVAPNLRLQASSTKSPAAPPGLEHQLQQAQGGGHAMPQELRAKVEPVMGADFSGVRLHTDSQADQLNQSIQARAFTNGANIFFKQGEYAPSSRSGQELIAHELTHVVQQGAAKTKTNASVRTTDDGTAQRKPNKRQPTLIQRTVRGATNKAGDNDELDTGAVGDEALGVLDTAAAYLGTGPTGPAGAPFAGGLPDSAGGAQMGGGALGSQANTVGGVLGAGINLVSYGQSVDRAFEAYQEFKAKKAELETLKGKGDPELYAAISLLEQEKVDAKTDVADNMASIVSAINGVYNGVFTAMNNLAGITQGLSVAIANVTFAIGAGLNAIIGSINAMRDFYSAYKRSKKQAAILQLAEFCGQLTDQVKGELEAKQSSVFDINDHLGSLHFLYRTTQEDLKKKIEAIDQKAATAKDGLSEQDKQQKVELEKKQLDMAIHHQDKIEGYEKELLATKAMMESSRDKVALLSQMTSGLGVSARKNGSKEKLMTGGLNAIGAGGGAALFIATVATVGAAVTPVGWALSGVAAVSILIYTASKFVKRRIRNSNVARMKQEKALIEQAIANGTKTKADTWNRSEYPTDEKKGKFNTFLNKIAPWKKRGKDGKMTLGDRLNHIDGYLAKYDVGAAGDSVYEGILAALTTDQGNQSVEVADDGTQKTFKEATEELMKTLGIDPAKLIDSMNSEDEEAQAKAKKLVLTKMRLIPQGKGGGGSSEEPANPVDEQ
ncbi:MAG: DUF4157 domain-containing protein [Cyanobacteria bacterium P01_H01_bin.121]